jgi:hypothetical protein
MDAGCMDSRVFALKKPEAKKWHGLRSYCPEFSRSENSQGQTAKRVAPCARTALAKARARPVNYWEIHLRYAFPHYSIYSLRLLLSRKG